MTYFFIHNSEDGIRVEAYGTEEAALAEIHELTGEDIVPEYRAEFIDFLPTEYTDPNFYLIIQGSVVRPNPVETVKRYML